MSCDCCQMTTLQVFRNETLWLGLDLHTDHLTDPQAERNRNKEKRKKHNYYFKHRLTKYEDQLIVFLFSSISDEYFEENQRSN